MKEKRYQVVIWSEDIGTDEKGDYSNKTEAVKVAKSYIETEEYAAIYDYKTKTAFVVFGNPFIPVFRDFVQVFYMENEKKKRAF